MVSVENFCKQFKDAVLLVNGEKQVVFCNRAAEELFQMPSEKMKGLSFLDVTQSLEMEAQVNEVLSSRAPALKEVHLARHDEKYLMCQMIPFSSEGGFSLACVFQDYTRFYKMEKARSDFAANVSHELKTPVAAVRSLAETLLRGAKDDPLVRDKFIASLYHETQRLSRILQDLLDLLRIESGEFHLEKKAISLRRVCGDVLRKFDGELTQKNVHVEIHIGEDAATIFADINAVEHILNNLVENAVKYTQEDGRITVDASANKEKNEVCVFVRDTGIGILSSDIERIFERFYRVDKARSRELGGTGLGLSIVKHLVEAHGGRVWAESQLNRGSTFYFSIPIPEN